MKSSTILIIAAILITTCSFLVTVWAAGPATTAPAATSRLQLTRWLNLTAQQQQAIQDADPDFDADVEQLQTAINSQRLVLADLLEDNNASDDQVMDQIEKVIRCNEDMERRVARHILRIRQLLEPHQRRQLMNQCAIGVRQQGQGNRSRWRGGRNDSSRHDGVGQGRGAGRGFGGGRGGRDGRGGSQEY